MTSASVSWEEADIAVIGAGAAGLMAAIAAAASQPSRRVTLFDTRQKIGAKILISGGTRCNVTNVKVSASDYEGAAPHFIRHVLAAFTPDQTRQFFERIGVPLVLEPTGKYFPTTHSGKTVLEALLKETNRLGIFLKTGIRVAEAKKEGEWFSLIEGAGKSFFRCHRLILATGGLSYPETGSDGTGYRIAQALGHTLTQTVPALTPLTTDDKDWQSLSGITLEAGLSFFKGGRKKKEVQDSFLFTHFGFSGPAALDISRHYALCPPEEKPEIFASFVPRETEETLRAFFESKEGGDKTVKNRLSEKFLLPERFLEVFFEKIKQDAKRPWKRFSSTDRRRLVHALLNCPLGVNGVVGYKKAEVTAGGIEHGQINGSTMESKKTAGLYFAGEIVDVDGRIGGFNFQWAWSSGTLAGRSAAKSFAK